MTHLTFVCHQEHWGEMCYCGVPVDYKSDVNYMQAAAHEGDFDPRIGSPRLLVEGVDDLCFRCLEDWQESFY